MSYNPNIAEDLKPFLRRFIMGQIPVEHSRDFRRGVISLELLGCTPEHIHSVYKITPEEHAQFRAEAIEILKAYTGPDFPCPVQDGERGPKRGMRRYRPSPMTDAMKLRVMEIINAEPERIWRPFEIGKALGLNNAGQAMMNLALERLVEDAAVDKVKGDTTWPRYRLK